MKVLDVLRLASRIFRTNRLRTFLTILGVSIGIGAIYFLVSLGYGLQRLTEQRIATSDSLVTLDVTAGTSSILKLDNDAIEDFRKIPNVAEVARLVAVDAQIQLDESVGETEVRGIDAPFLRLGGVKVQAGRSLQENDENAIMVTSSVLKLFSLEGENAGLGKRVKIFNFAVPTVTETGEKGEPTIIEKEKEFEIVGVINDDQVSTYVPLSSLEDLKLATYDNVKVKAKSKEFVADIRDAVSGKGFLVSAVTDVLDQLDRVFKVVQIVLGGFGIIALTVAAIGMFNTMTIALLERTHEIGIMKSIGVANRDVWRLFLTESMIIGISGGVVGIAIGWAAGKGVNILINVLARSLGGEAVQLFWIPLWFLTVILSFATIVGFATGLYPAKRAARLNPLVALRYE